jgi:proline dehydrogenase
MVQSLVNHTIAKMLPLVPRPIVWRVSRRYIAGVTLEDALDRIEGLNRQGMTTTIDVLGEDVLDADQVPGYRDLYLRALDAIQSRGLDCYASIKLSEMGLRFDPQLCASVMEELVTRAAEHGNFVRIDMEDSSVTDATLELYRDLRSRHDNVGAVIQACLHRSADDIESLLASGIAHVRLCKGIYIEPTRIAYREPEEVNRSYMALLEQLFAGNAEKVCIATHHPRLIQHAENVIRDQNIGRDRYEFQMLLGVAESLRDSLVARGHPLRVYVPFGEHWYAYSSRRLRENPQIAGHVLKNLLTPG